MEKRSPLGFNPAPNYTGERKGGPDPSEGISVFQTSIPPFLILISPIPPQDSTNEYSDIHIIYTGMKKHQIKSCWYYMFWGAATLSVLIGQLHVGSGYNRLSNTLELQLLSKCNNEKT